MDDIENPDRPVIHVTSEVERTLDALRIADPGEIAAIATKIDDAFAALSVDDRTRLLCGLSDRPSREATRAWVQICATHAPAGRLPCLAADGLIDAPRHADLVFPAVLAHLDDATIASDVVWLLHAYCRQRLLDATALAPHAAQLLGAYRAIAAEVQAHAMLERPGWRWAPEYAATRATAGAMLDVLGALPAAIAAGPLHEALDGPDPLLRLHALVALLQLECDVNDATLAALPNDLETRAWTWEALDCAGLADRVPPELRSPTALATSAMAAWLADSDWLGTLPDEIELAEAIPFEGHDAGWWYVYRVRVAPPHPLAAGGWRAAVAGPMPAPDSGVAALPGKVATQLEPWEARIPAAHLSLLQPLAVPFPYPPYCR
jgi:hypothetical protein